jgi:hypothetical protein
VPATGRDSVTCEASRVPRRWIVDARNVMGARPDGWWRDPARALARLLDEITRWRAVTAEPVLVVVDGDPTPRAPEGSLHGVAGGDAP